MLKEQLTALESRMRTLQSEISTRDTLVLHLRSIIEGMSTRNLRDAEVQTDDSGVVGVGLGREVTAKATVSPVAESVIGRLQTKNVMGSLSTVVEKPKRRKIVILSDTHGSGSGLMLSDFLGGLFEVFACCKPNAELTDVVRDAHLLCKDLSENDFVIIIGGFNSSMRGRNLPSSAMGIIERIANQCNIVYVSVPYRSRQEALNANIYNFNVKMYNFLNSLCIHKNIFVDANSILTYADKTRCGLHLNIRGKTRLFRYVANLIIGTSDSDSTDSHRNSNLITVICSDRTDNSNVSNQQNFCHQSRIPPHK